MPMHGNTEIFTPPIPKIHHEVSLPVRKRDVFIVSRWYDLAFFILSPLLALALGITASFTPLAQARAAMGGKAESFVTMVSGVVTMAHLVIVFFRSHANPGIFRLYPKRFILAPLILFGAMMLSSWVLVFVFVLAVWWDVYHSSLQTFGLGRLYDKRAGNDVRAARGLDQGLNLLLYAGPIFAGATLMAHAEHFHRFRDVGTALFARIPEVALANQKYYAPLILGFGICYVAYYCLSYGRLYRKGYRIAWPKVALYAATGLCSIYTWGFNTFGQAFFIMNFFHALQYFALIWWAENKNLTAVLRLDRFGWGKGAALLLFLGAGIGYGLWAHFLGESSHAAFSLLLTVSILHFWYDGFIWSVRKGQV